MFAGKAPVLIASSPFHAVHCHMQLELLFPAMRVYPRCRSTDDYFSKQHTKFMKNILTTLSNCMIAACIDGIENKGIKIKDARLLA
jgi:hypothetical protein